MPHSVVCAAFMFKYKGKADWYSEATMSRTLRYQGSTLDIRHHCIVSKLRFSLFDNSRERNQGTTTIINNEQQQQQHMPTNVLRPDLQRMLRICSLQQSSDQLPVILNPGRWAWGCSWSMHLEEGGPHGLYNFDTHVCVGEIHRLFAIGHIWRQYEFLPQHNSKTIALPWCFQRKYSKLHQFNTHRHSCRHTTYPELHTNGRTSSRHGPTTQHFAMIIECVCLEVLPWVCAAFC